MNQEWHIARVPEWLEVMAETVPQKVRELIGYQRGNTVIER